ncbi:MAG: Eight transrane protein EpsH [Pedosphaera sp.]|nr:Eight transrane protein EpsH [Pedosphaera sp.]
MDNTQNSPAAARDFKAEFLQAWQQLPDKGMFFGLLAAWLLLFQFLGNGTFGYIDTASLMHWMVNAYTHGESEDGQGLLIPFVVLVLFWWKRKQLLSVPNRTWMPGLLLLGAALILHLFGYLVQQPRISIVALFTGIYALIGLVWGPAWMRASFFPFFLFIFCMPISSIGEQLTVPMRLLVSKLVWVISHGLGIDIVQEGNQLFNAQRTYQYEVADPCSGLRSLMAITALTTIYGFVTFEKNWKRAVMIASAFPLALLGNLLRMMMIIIAAEFSGQKAGNSVHDSGFFSLLPYIPAIIGVLVLGHWLGEKPEKAGKI